MKKIFYVTFIVFIYFLAAYGMPTYAQADNPLRPYIDSGDGRGVNPGDATPTKSPSEQATEKQSNIIRNAFDRIFDKNITDIPLPQQTNPLPAPLNNLLPTGAANPSITYFPPADPSNILNDSNITYPESILANVRKCLPNKQIYETAAAQTGIPWIILAGIHYTETGGSCSPNSSLISGRQIGIDEPDLYGNCSSQDTGLGKAKPIGYSASLQRTLCAFDNLLDTAVYAGIHLKRTNNGIPKTHQELLLMVSNYNGGGNSNCLGGTSYKFCPPLYERDDDTYNNDKKPSADGRYDVMYIRYCADHKTCQQMGLPNPVHQVYGVLTVAGALSRL